MIRQFTMVILLLAIASVAIPAVSAEIMTMHPASAPDGIDAADGSSARIISITYYVLEGSMVYKRTLVPDPNVTLQIPVYTHNIVKITAKVRYTGPEGTRGIGIISNIVPLEFHDCKIIPAGKSVTLSSDAIFQTTAGGQLLMIEVDGNNKSQAQSINVIFS